MTSATTLRVSTFGLGALDPARSQGKLAVAACSGADEALRFAAHGAIVGSGNAQHLRRNAELAARGPLPASWASEIRAAFGRCGEHWDGLIWCR